MAKPIRKTTQRRLFALVMRDGRLWAEENNCEWSPRGGHLEVNLYTSEAIAKRAAAAALLNHDVELKPVEVSVDFKADR